MDAEVATVAAAVLCAITQYNYLYIKNKKEIKKKWKKKNAVDNSDSSYQNKYV